MKAGACEQVQEMLAYCIWDSQVYHGLSGRGLGSSESSRSRECECCSWLVPDALSVRTLVLPGAFWQCVLLLPAETILGHRNGRAWGLKHNSSAFERILAVSLSISQPSCLAYVCDTFPERVF